MDVQKIREDYPILNTGIVYLDSASTSLTPEPVLEKMLEYYREYRANVGRGLYKLSQRATEELEEARKKIAGFINAKPEEMILVRNTTEGINTVSLGLSWEKGDNVVTTVTEHHSNYMVWLRVAQRFGVELRILWPDSRGVVPLAEVEKKVDDRTKLVSIAQVSNVLGTKLPVEEFSRIAHDHGAYMLVDGAQSVPHLQVDVRRLGCDFLAFSGHKMCGPTGSGGLFIREEVMEEVEPLLLGGGAIVDVDTASYRLEEKARRFEAGTPAVGEAIGLGAAADYLKKIGLEKIEAHERNLTLRIYEALKAIPRLRVHGPEPEWKVGITCFNIGNLNPHDVALFLDSVADVEVRSGLLCAHPLMREVLKEPQGAVRVSTYLYNTQQDVERFISAVEEIAHAFNSKEKGGTVKRG
ncbi:cysteine desulfurase [Candidatus Hecatella orcuttiae]|uniref:aminotransferase class V-fold PLP-dependent enzyme n=1 Tax=Candidatus Hecatella orcuttiae TaxID=1935119 RepID=UPI002867B544|nr:cysteine desulfurase [Candidatus Hecatella orcuttiae]